MFNLLDTREDLNLKELFAYKVLEGLGVGAEVHFIDKHLGLRFIVYIASREIASFRTINEIESNETDDLCKYTTSVVQMLFLYTILNMGDHHSNNMGLGENGTPYIIDF